MFRCFSGSKVVLIASTAAILISANASAETLSIVSDQPMTDTELARTVDTLAAAEAPYSEPVDATPVTAEGDSLFNLLLTAEAVPDEPPAPVCDENAVKAAEQKVKEKAEALTKSVEAYKKAKKDFSDELGKLAAEAAKTNPEKIKFLFGDISKPEALDNAVDSLYSNYTRAFGPSPGRALDRDLAADAKSSLKQKAEGLGITYDNLLKKLEAFKKLKDGVFNAVAALEDAKAELEKAQKDCSEGVDDQEMSAIDDFSYYYGFEAISE